MDLHDWLDRPKTFWMILSRSPEPWPRRIVLAAKNLTIKAVHHSDCCGHYGEPGC